MPASIADWGHRQQVGKAQTLKGCRNLLRWWLWDHRHDACKMKAWVSCNAINLKAHLLETAGAFRALGRDHGTLQTKAESVIVGYALSEKCVTHYLSFYYPMNTSAEAIRNCPA